MFRKILVALNRNDEITEHVFKQALDLAVMSQASLKLLHVISVDDKDSPSILNLINSPENKKRWEEFEKPGLDLLKSLAQQAIAAGVETEYSQTLGRPGNVICETARRSEAGVIVIGRRGLSGISELILGSVSNYVSHYAPCSVMIVQVSESFQTNGVAERQKAAVY